ncbi:MAG: guanylate kinase [Archangium gephyra]|uniref:Guanylate kinase n=1 Tax=Archangium gephyra TaxID=48 RepID=A0A2W5SU58_9BACT|nr:MAG: guanylate kinase [Archangium gephyra]
MPVILSPGLLLVLSAPSGAGKTTLAHMLEKVFPSAEFSVSYTTRPPRGAEKDGVDYHFVDTLTFEQMIARNEFVEWAEVFGNFYGSSKKVVDQSWKPGGIGIFDIDVQGGTSIKRKYPDAVTIFILPPSMEALERRLRGRGTDSDEVIRRRMLAARAECEKGVQAYDYLIINDQLQDAFDHLKGIVTSERSRRGRVDISPLGLQIP